MFRKDFVWGAATSAYQVEGRDKDDGAGKNIWETFADNGKIFEHQNAYISCDHMHRYKDDFALMRLLGIKAYRFSVSWARVLPEGTGKVNHKAIAMYRDMLLEMRKNGIEPYMTLYHWDLPQALENKGGWQNEESANWFGEYAKVISENFSDICRNFITINEPECIIGLGYLTGTHAPGKKLTYKETFEVTHNLLKAHGSAVINLRKYARQKINIGYTITSNVPYPENGNNNADVEATKQAMFSFSDTMDQWPSNAVWFLDPVIFGKYPENGLRKFEEYLPKITHEDMELISQPLDFIGLNIYFGYPVREAGGGKTERPHMEQGFARTAANWPVTPESIYWGARFTYERYKMPIFITENGMSCHDCISPDGCVHDPNRIDFLDSYLGELQKAISDGADVRGYFLWSFLDNLEWAEGYNERFGIVYVDFQTLTRTVKDSAFWYKKVIESNGKTLTVNTASSRMLFIKNEAEKTNGTSDYIVSEGKHNDKHLSELCKTAPELFGSIKDSFKIVTEMIDTQTALNAEENIYLAKNSLYKLETHELYSIYHASVDGYTELGKGGRFVICSVISGKGIAGSRMIKAGDIFMFPYKYGNIKVYGKLHVIFSYLN